MLKGFFSVDGKFFAVTSKIVDLVIVTLLWIAGCLPVVTIVTSTASMYHTVVKCIRYDRGSVFADFKEAYKKNLRQGVCLTLLYGAVGALLAWGDYQVFAVSQNRSTAFFVLAVGLLILSMVYLLNVIWLIPVFSRFSDTLRNILRLNYVVAIRNLLRSIPILLILAAAVILVLATNETLLFVPAVAALLNSYFSEPGLWRFMPPREAEDDDWRYGPSEKNKK